MTLNNIVALFLIIAIVSFLGFWVENIWLSITKGYMDNRNMRLPFLLGYGLAMVAIFGMFGTPQAPRFFHIPISIDSTFGRSAIYFGITCLCVMVGEIALGTFVEKTTGIVWWNYTRLPLHITKYTSIPTTLAFGGLITTFMGCFFSPLYTYFSHSNSKVWMMVAFVLMALMVIDFMMSAIGMFKTKELLKIWKINMAGNPIHQFVLAKRPST